ncbi:hypothetical protein TH53_11560 [Pedobacter lusitanus]|uniref:Contig48, whole genome shotgun sequence n=1 Tax=Pedobacter lusitanus TaxID=1503925 RepID=A0A0D0GR56_9SPHI|nr:DUF4369 domain-containing protein [Pedobacter lusitanus]KIO77001.1 hypothetical protein TH53_11560 [Pedobacter lusitanus]
MGKTIILLSLIVYFLVSACSNGGQKISVYPKTGIGEKIYLSTVTIDGAYKKKDSAIVLENGKEITFHIYSAEQQIYAISSSFNDFTVFFINDQGNKTIHTDSFSRTYKVNGSAATNSLIHFQKKQDALLKKICLIKDYTLSQLLKHRYNQNYINYADTVQNPVAFLIVNDKVDFGSDLNGLERFIKKAHKKFKGNRQFDQIYAHALNYLQQKKETRLITYQKKLYY